jgi:transcriptional regulator with XRE-family HTH domain
MKKNQAKPGRDGGAETIEPHREAAALDAPLSLEKCVGAAIRDLRLRKRLTIAQVSLQASISGGMLSKIETGQISAGMDSLSRIARALGTTMAMLFRTYDVPTGGAHFVKRGQGMPFLRHGTRPGHTFQLLSYDQGSTRSFETFLVTIDADSESLPTIEHPGTELIHMLEGSMEYRSGQSVYLLEPGDTLTLTGEILHGPERLIQRPIRFVSVIIYPPPAA